MTIDEVINVLRWLNPPRVNKKSFDDFKQAIEMAIDALEQAKTNCSENPNNSDTISRTQAIDVLEERLQNSGYSNVALVSELNRSIGYLMRLPPAQPEPERTMEEFMYGQDMGNPEDGSL